MCGSTQEPISIYSDHAQLWQSAGAQWGDCDPQYAKLKQDTPQLERGGTSVVAFLVFLKRKRELDDNIPDQNF